MLDLGQVEEPDDRQVLLPAHQHRLEVGAPGVCQVRVVAVVVGRRRARPGYDPVLAQDVPRLMIPYPFTDSATSAKAVRRLLEYAYPEVRDASLKVHPDDDMYAFSVNTIGSEPLGAMAYFRAGASMIDAIDTIATWHFGSLDSVGSFLDFAAGYGRSTRFLVQRLVPRTVSVAEVQADALEFQAREFGVSTIKSTSHPAALRATRVFDFVFVASLFSHLPLGTFGPWLSKIWKLVAPGGVLVFSVHDEALDTFGADWKDGFAFIAANEVSALDTADYGTAFTTEAFVRGQLADAADEDVAAKAVRLPKGLCFDQDLWVVPRGHDKREPLVRENGPNGSLDRLAVEGRRFELSGWAADTGFAAVGAESHAITRVWVSITDGTVIDAQLGLSRPDVAAHLSRPGDPRLAGSGWIVRGTARRRLRLEDIVTVTASCEHGAQFVLDSARISDVLTRTGQGLHSHPIQRRFLTAKTVYRQGGLTALVALMPVFSRNEAERLRGVISRRLRSRPSRLRQARRR